MVGTAKNSQDPAIIDRLQREALGNPRAYRLRLALLAIAGDIALTVAQVLPLAAPIIFGVLLVNRWPFYWLGAATLVFLAWLLRPTFRFEGREVKADEAPRLHKDIAALRKTLDVDRRLRVYLDDSFNASAAETRGLFGRFGT